MTRSRALVKAHVVTVPQIAGCCRWCRCTYEEPCAGGCGWADRAQTLCTACVPLDRALRTHEGRRELADFLQETGFLRGTRDLRPGRRKKLHPDRALRLRNDTGE